MATLYDSAFEGLCSKNPVVYFVLPTPNIITIFYCLLKFMHLQKKIENAKKLVANLA